MNLTTPGYKELRFTYSLSSDGDAWGDALTFHFAVAEALTHAGDGEVPAEWGFRDSPQHASPLPADDWPDAELMELTEAGTVTSDDLRAFGHVLHRYLRILRDAGRDY